MNHSDIDIALIEASKWIGEYWPLQGSVATNPLWHKIDLSFSMVSKQLATQGISTTMPLSFYWQQHQQGNISMDHLSHAIKSSVNKPAHTALDCLQQTQQQLSTLQHKIDANPSTHRILNQCTHWLGQYFDQGEASWQVKDDLSLIEFWRRYSGEKVQSIKDYLVKLAIAPKQYETHFTLILSALRGYASLIKWLHQHPENPWVKAQANLETLTLMWLHYECQESSQHTVETFAFNHLSSELVELQLIWQRAYEWSVQQPLLAILSKQTLVDTKQTPQVQFIFCMDPRSEGFRRHLEQHPEYQTFAAAGFFGFAFKLQETTQHACQWQAPGLINADTTINYRLKPPILRGTTEAVKAAQNNSLSSFGLIEILNLWPAIKLLLKQYLPELYQYCATLFSTNKPVSIDFKQADIDPQQAAEQAYGLLTRIGLTDYFAPAILICGHAASADNNPLLSSLQCGACGGNSGAVNAAIAAQALNHPEVRQHLKTKGILIPEQTQFIAACHNTTTDELQWKMDSSIPNCKLLNNNILAASQRLRTERLKAWPNHTSVWRKQNHWAELIPELGSANHTALIIAPRALTRGLDLKRRTFLHDYALQQDESGVMLESILFGRAVVAHLINSYYYFSTVDPLHFGGGNKTIHNLIGNIGVIEGNSGDLKIGLPEQSIWFGKQLLHEPRRLMIVVYAPEQRVQAILKRNTTIRHLVENEWLFLETLSPVT